MTSKRCIAPILILGLIASFANSPARGQWSSDPANNLSIGDGAADQNQPKIAPTDDGGCYISWYSNLPSGYDVRLQRLSSKGVELWPHNGILVADRSFSSTVDYGMVSDGENAILVFNDDRVVPTQITAQKVNPAGTLLWNGPSGVNVGPGTSPPSIAFLSDGGVAVIWSTSASPISTIIQKLDANGNSQWGASGINQIDTLVPQRGLQASDVQSDGAGGAIVLFVRCNGTSCGQTVAKHLYVQRYNSAGVALWNEGSPMPIYTATSIGPAVFPRFLPDGLGGGVFAWAEGSTARLALLQHVEADGSLKFGGPISAGNSAGRGKLTASLGYNADTGDYFVGCSDSSFPTQGNYTTTIQKINSNGDLQWGPGGHVLIGGTGNVLQASFIHCRPVGEGVIVSWLWQNSSGPDNGLAYSARVEGDLDEPTTVWNVESGAQNTAKSRLFGAWSECGYVLLGWGQGGFGSQDVKAQNVRPDGTFGNPPPLLGDLDCDGTVDIPDVGPFTQALLDPPAYGVAHPCCDINMADMNVDTGIDGLDIADFVTALMNP